MLEERWPGIPIPNLPPKKAIGNKDVKFINERRFYLERFLKKISPFDFILDSQEFLLFTRPKQGQDIEKTLSALPKLTGSFMVDRYTEALKIDHTKYDLIKKAELNSNC